MYIIYKEKGGGSPDDEMWNLTSCTSDLSNLLVAVQDTGHRTIEIDGGTHKHRPQRRQRHCKVTDKYKCLMQEEEAVTTEMLSKTTGESQEKHKKLSYLVTPPLVP